MGARAQGTHPPGHGGSTLRAPGQKAPGTGRWERGGGVPGQPSPAHPAAPSCLANSSRWYQFKAAPHTCPTCLVRSSPPPQTFPKTCVPRKCQGLLFPLDTRAVSPPYRPYDWVMGSAEAKAVAGTTAWFWFYRFLSVSSGTGHCIWQYLTILICSLKGIKFCI